MMRVGKGGIGMRCASGRIRRLEEEGVKHAGRQPARPDRCVGGGDRHAARQPAGRDGCVCMGGITHQIGGRRNEEVTARPHTHTTTAGLQPG
eukprot:260704-Chlamydomonas_euryale.AAC.2